MIYEEQDRCSVRLAGGSQAFNRFQWRLNLLNRPKVIIHLMLSMKHGTKHERRIYWEAWSIVCMIEVSLNSMLEKRWVEEGFDEWEAVKEKVGRKMHAIERGQPHLHMRRRGLERVRVQKKTRLILKSEIWFEKIMLKDRFIE